MGLEILVSDPWEFGTQHGVGPFRCALLQADDRGWIAAISKAIIIKGKPWTRFWIKARLAGWPLSDVFRGREIGANFITTSEGLATASSRFPGSFAGIGSVRLQRATKYERVTSNHHRP